MDIDESVLWRNIEIDQHVLWRCIEIELKKMMYMEANHQNTDTEEKETETDLEKMKTIGKAFRPVYCSPFSDRLTPGTFKRIPGSRLLPSPKSPVPNIVIWRADMQKHKAKWDRVKSRNAQNEDLRNEKQKTATDMEMKTEEEDAAIAKAPTMDKYRPTPNSDRLLPATFQSIPVDPCSIPWPHPPPPVPDNLWDFFSLDVNW